MSTQDLATAAGEPTATPAPAPPAFNPFAVELPDKFDFRQPEGWKRWVTRWERYRIISGLQKQDSSTQVNTFLYAMGTGAEDVLVSMRLTDEVANDYDKLKSAFDKYFVPSRNVIYERARFNLRSQLEHETVEEFFKELHRLAEFCEFASLKEELIRDKLVVGLRDSRLSERLQLDSQLTLEKAVTMARNSEAVKGQQNLLRGNEPPSQAPTANTTLDVVTSSRPASHKGRQSEARPPAQRPAQPKSDPCKWCGSMRFHPRIECPAQGKVCSQCGKLGHFASVCRTTPAPKPASGRGRRAQRPKQSRRALEEVFLDGLQHPSSSDAWFITILVNGRPIKFKVDTGADVTAVPESALYPETRRFATRPTKRLYGPGKSLINTLGQVHVDMSWNGKTTNQEVFIVDGLQHSRLGRPAIKALEVLPQLLEIGHDHGHDCIASMYPELFGGLGLMKATYSIHLVPGPRPYAVTYPRRVALPLLPSVQAEIHRMEGLGVIQKVEHATEWCAPMVVVRKKNGKLRICVDFGELIKQVVRERVIMPTVEENLSKITEAKVFSKLDANAGYWQAPLSRESRELTTFITPFGRYQFLRLPFGIATAPEFFQREMSRILQDLDGTVCHMDDVLIYGKNQEQHDRRLHAALRKLSDAGITLNEEKCQFTRTRIHFLGHVLDERGIYVDPEKTEAIRKMRAPESASELRSLFGMLTHLMKFLPGLAEKTKVLRELLSSDAAWYWGPQHEQSFKQIKKDLTTSPILAYYSPLRPHTLSVDASSYGLGAVLLQEETDSRRHL
ncbi:uncharacterized protein K02A2.6-like [Ornithodoros turicata]|uniref:uncharacterized protein K02A2.6-like n=1 Tax=Ornithodoros turicata TaxID=34597 RepID=UPI003139E1B9